uniref:Uncharacterized protein n=1 Tax=Glossina austeni TaxID=7395 RepID=A0A1A9UD41_GLOAU
MENNWNSLQIQYCCAKETIFYEVAAAEVLPDILKKLLGLKSKKFNLGMVAFSAFSADYSDCATRCTRRTSRQNKSSGKIIRLDSYTHYDPNSKHSLHTMKIHYNIWQKLHNKRFRDCGNEVAIGTCWQITSQEMVISSDYNILIKTIFQNVTEIRGTSPSILTLAYLH